MEAKHTPGPWFVSHREPSVCSIWRRDPKELYENGGTVAGERPLATIWPGWTGSDETGFPVLANARLMAAAPELLGALIAIDKRLTECAAIPASAADAYDSDFQEMVRDAITKATGGEG